MIVLSNDDTYTNTVRESAESAHSGSFTRVRVSDPNPLLIKNELVYGTIEYPDCEPFRGSIIIGVRGSIPFLSLRNLKIVQRLQSFRLYFHNWDSYGAECPSSVAIDRAINFVRQLDECGISVYFVAPGPDGEILVELQKGDKSAELYFHEDYPSQFVFFQEDQQLSEGLLVADRTFISQNLSVYR